ncbi:urease accessory protein UreF [Paenibacillus silvae]|uniref:Urease accessory protein UreF n=1 Tax=Paenibacillus silvae TaxID=1325358 RepID=A0ABQ1ZB28_9BACL|nr:urease accessory UreF family protein [Paenibacillus silvae]MCK6074815.1 urease accessory protein UreF [Paenibacillus silvae]MCK6147710.1 urease accessory protein UreF [Paenibacillus silvae]MCK6266008.1 urease accessory protein UreF [Paenibacillus silvae]GGH56033.1 urease accessory protein UreF [Paenibacillus silvae]
MNRGNKLLDYVKLLDPSVQVGGFSHFFGMDTHIKEGTIRTVEDLESFMRCQLHPSLVRLEGMAIKGIYTAIDHKDTWRIALIDKLVHVQRTPAELREKAATIGKRLIKLSHALHPWIEFKPLEQIFTKYSSVGCLPTVHAWINHHLDIPVEEAVLGYLHSAMYACISEASKAIPLSENVTKELLGRLTTDLEHEWKTVSASSPDGHMHPASLSMKTLFPSFHMLGAGLHAYRA